MSQFEFGPAARELRFVVTGRQAAGVGLALFDTSLELGRLVYRPWLEGAPLAAVCLLEADRLEIRIPDANGWPDRLRDRLTDLGGTLTDSTFDGRLQALIARLEAWSYADTDPGEGPPEIAAALAALESVAPSEQAQRALRAAREALDDGLPADAVVAALNRGRVGGDGA